MESANDRYDLIVVDQKMPNLSGVELIDEIRKRGIPGEIIVISAHVIGKPGGVSADEGPRDSAEAF